ncbi:uncharacterized protein IL334_005340 [Kwoniella shivajii]|uniref:PSP1 C-terminal domain-containing protein n=1 Tax=Kwoniella shivajii TaxID=564305 RepID=A0ABZ1D2V5_9TREE|nr:hypothetical protein IL334_005340 [Kwoniella shivajii]
MSTLSPSKSQTLPPIQNQNHNPNSPNPNAPPFRPSPARAATLSGTPFQYKTRAASQPAGERIPPSSSTPGSGRASPGAGMNANGLTGSGSAFGVIGGARIPGRFGNALFGSNGNVGIQTRANSFSAGEIRDPRNTSLARTLSSHTEEFVPSRSQSTSPFPTFSPNSTPSTSPAAIRQQPLPPSPPKAGANVSRSRSQSLATGVRPSSIDRPWLAPMSTLENKGAFAKIDVGWNISPNEGSNMSPFSRGLPALGNNPARDEVYGRNGNTPGGRFKAAQEGFSTRGGWGASPNETNTTSALSSSVHKALGGGYQQQPYAQGGGGYGEYTNPANGGSRSGASSRRHSVSVVGGPGGRREFSFGEPGMGITSLSPPSKGLFGFESELGNALSLDIDERKRDDNGYVSASLPKFDIHDRFNESSHQRIPSLSNRKNDNFNDGVFPTFGSTPPRGRLEGLITGNGAFAAERATSGESNGSRRFLIENAAVGSPIVGHDRLGNGNGNGNATINGNPSSNGFTGSPERLREQPLSSARPQGINGLGPGVIGAPVHNYGNGNNQFAPNVPPGNSYPGMRPFGGPGPLNNASQGHLNGPGSGSNGYGRSPIGQGPPGPGFGGYYGLPNRPPPPPQGGFSPQLGFNAPPPGNGYSGPNQNQNGPYGNVQPGSGGGGGGGYQSFYPNPAVPSSPPQPTSPSFSTLSLSDLGKGIILSALPTTTPLYIVTFKAGRRDVYYCPDPTLLISNGDKVIVEADRGSDLGTVIYDQLTSIDIRDWQERQATAALLSGASQHQPPGLAVSGIHPSTSNKEIKKQTSSGELGSSLGLDLDGLLLGCGPSGQPELSGTMVRGPLAKEIMPKRIFAKSSQGVEEQNRMTQKVNDEYEALMICREKVIERGLPMQIVDAEYQWDRRKLTFYFKADKRVDFRDLTKENFRIFKSRIWMSMVSKDDPRN